MIPNTFRPERSKEQKQTNNAADSYLDDHFSYHILCQSIIVIPLHKRHLMLQMNWNSKYCTMILLIVTTTANSDSAYLHNDDHIDVYNY